jgi:EAL domain-containing protein (putative c-di-GMP-specific phosphodiesterase class I)
MLFTLIYRSRLQKPLSSGELQRLEAQARLSNARLQVTGVLLFDGDYFLQALEGPQAAVEAVFERIARDPRHDRIVTLLRDWAPSQRFSAWGMQLLDGTTGDGGAALRRWLDTHLKRAPDHRAFRVVEAFVSGAWRREVIDADPAAWQLVVDPGQMLGPAPGAADAPCRFALQPIVSTTLQQVTSYEALLRSPAGGSPQECFGTVAPDQWHRFDLESKTHALALAARLGLGERKLALNLSPMSLVGDSHAVDNLLEQVRAQGLRPEQIIVEVTEEQAISHFELFLSAMRRLRGAGFSITIDDFDAGHAGLSLLARFQPDKIKIDRSLVQGIDGDGPRQAIVHAVLDVSLRLGIDVVAEGVETLAEWSWLQAAGVERFQGYLFARPALDGAPAIHWPQRIAPADAGSLQAS